MTMVTVIVTVSVMIMVVFESNIEWSQGNEIKSIQMCTKQPLRISSSRVVLVLF